MANEPSIVDAPGPRGPELLRTLLELREDPLRACVTLKQRFGPLASVSPPQAGSSFCLIHEPETVRRVLADRHGLYSKDTASYARLRPVLGGGILTAEGEAWRTQRRAVAPCLHAARQHTLLGATSALTVELISRWRTAACHGEAVDVRRDMVWLTLSILARSLFESDARSTVSEVGAALDCVMGETSRSRPGRPSEARRKRFSAAIARLGREIERVRGEPAARVGNPWNLVSALSRGGTGCPFSGSAEPAKDETATTEALLTMYLAGHETTATTLVWALWLLARHPEAARRVRAEATRELSRPGPLDEAVARLHFTRAVLHETLRLYPPVWLVERRVEREHVLAGYRVPVGTTLGLCLFLAQRDEALWPAPEAFVPERFFAEGARRRLLAFGVGPRGCAGAAFALDEMTLALAELERHVELSIESPAVLEGGVTLRAREPLLARLAAA